MAVFINEINYDTEGTDVNERIEIAATAGTDLTGWSVVLYNGSNGTSYRTDALSGIVADLGSGFGTFVINYPSNGIQNGAPDGIALVNAAGEVVQFLSYEGIMTATNGPAAGLTSIDIGVSQSGGVADQPNNSLQLTGSGTEYSDFTWATTATSTFGAANNGQSFGGGTTPSAGTLSLGDVSAAEGDAGTTTFTFTITRDGGSAGAATVDYTLGFGTTDASDLVAGTALAGSVSFADGQTSTTITVEVVGDTDVEGDEDFTISLSNPTGGVAIADGVATGTITNDDVSTGEPSGYAFINEIHYDNAGTDAGEGIEIAGSAGTDLSGWSLVLYNGSSGSSTAGLPYNTIALSGLLSDQNNGFGTLSFMLPVNGLQNGDSDAIALVNNAGEVVQFLSYEGTMTATDGPAAGMTSTDIGVAQTSAPAGTSLQLIGEGGSYEDFTWVSADQTFNAINTGQTFLDPNVPGTFNIVDSSVIEGDSGTTQMLLTVRRSGGSALESTVNWSVALDGSADAADLAAGAAISGSLTFAAGVLQQQIIIEISGDTVAEGNETFSVNLSDPTNAGIGDGTATGTLTNDDPIALAIYDIQGAGHASEYAGQTVITDGIVTAVDTNGFYLQSATGDGNAATSDAIFVFTNSAPTVAVGDAASVRGTVAEYAPGNNSANLATTQIEAPTVTVTSSGNALPEATLIGVDGVLPPSAIFDNDGFTSFDITEDAADFYESLEGMRVTIDAPLVVSPTNSFGETWVVASGGEGATGVNDRGGITISDADNDGLYPDMNPERIQLDDDSGLFAGYAPDYTQGDILSNVTGIMSYNFQSYELLVTEAVTVTEDAPAPTREVTSIAGDAETLTMSNYNLENLSAVDSQTKFDILASDIVYNLNAPDIIGVQEIQDADGAGSGSDLSGYVTAQRLIDAITAAGGPEYAYIEIAPDTANSTGGEPGGNIRNGFFYQVDRVSYVEGSVELVTGSAYNGSRNPLAASFDFNGNIVTAISIHSTSRGGSDPLFGADQPPVNGGEASRMAQSQALLAYVTDILANDPGANLAVMGDFNAFYFEESVTMFEGENLLANVLRLLPEEERYTYIFEGNAQNLDNMLVSQGLYATTQADVVHLNAEQPDDDNRGTDHDPIVASFFFGTAPTDLVLNDNEIDENLPAGTVVGTLSATDSAGNVLNYTLTDDADGLFAVDAQTGEITATQSFNHEAQESYTITATVTDQSGLSASQDFTIVIGDVNEAPVAANDSAAINEDATSANLWSTLLANDSDVDDGDSLTISAVDTSDTRGSVIFDAATQTLRYVADHDDFDALAPGATTTDSFTYTVTDEGGLTSTATVTFTVTGIQDGITVNAGSRNDTITGTAGEDTLNAGNGNDTVYGLGGHDFIDGENGNDRLFGGDGNDTVYGGNGNDALEGGNGNDRLFGEMGNDTLFGGTGDDWIEGGMGNDTLSGGDGADSFVFSWLGGNDTVTDFNVNEDQLIFEDYSGYWRVQQRDVNRDGTLDSVIQTLGGQVTLLGVSDFNQVEVDYDGFNFPVFRSFDKYFELLC